ncbi:MAG: hypothetical protein EZS28_038400, partial [Streblomastix strix]
QEVGRIPDSIIPADGKKPQESIPMDSDDLNCTYYDFLQQVDPTLLHTVIYKSLLTDLVSPHLLINQQNQIGQNQIKAYEEVKKLARALTYAQQYELLLLARGGGTEKKKIQKPIEEQGEAVGDMVMELKAHKVKTKSLPASITALQLFVVGAFNVGETMTYNDGGR